MNFRKLIPILFTAFVQVAPAYAIRPGDSIVRIVSCRSGSPVDFLNTVQPGWNLTARTGSRGSLAYVGRRITEPIESYLDRRPPCPIGDSLTMISVEVMSLSCAIQKSYDRVAAESIIDLDLSKNIGTIETGEEIFGIRMTDDSGHTASPCPKDDWLLIRLSKPTEIRDVK